MELGSGGWNGSEDSPLILLGKIHAWYERFCTEKVLEWIKLVQYGATVVEQERDAMLQQRI